MNADEDLRPGTMKGKPAWLSLAIAIVLVLVLSTCSNSSTPPDGGAPAGDLHRIKHIVIIMQENRSFDHYFGTFPGADGIAMNAGQPTACLPPGTGAPCVRPYHDTGDVNAGGPHGTDAAVADIDGGKMDGFLEQGNRAATTCKNFTDPACRSSVSQDVASYHDDREIPNYWAYARNFVLQDRMFQSDAGWSLPSHQYLVSAWAARCKEKDAPMTCQSAPAGGQLPPDAQPGKEGPDPVYGWTDVTWLLHKHQVPWRYYVMAGIEPDCRYDDDVVCSTKAQDAKTPGIWNPLPWFDTVRADDELGNVVPVDDFYRQAKDGSLPAVSWIAPSGTVSEHPPSKISDGQAFTTGLMNAVMNGPDWASSAIFLAWDDWGGFYDHVVPPKVDGLGYGLRVPGLVVSPFAKQGLVDHQTLSFDAYLKFIEDVFLDGERIDPKTDGRPDRRPDVRENEPVLGNLTADFDFSQQPRAPMVLPTRPS